MAHPVPAPSAIVLAASPAPLARAADGSRLLRAWLDGRGERTIRAYSQDLEDFRAFLGAESVNGAAEELLARGHGAANETGLAYRAHLVGRGLAPATINRRLAALRSLVSLARTLGMVPWGLEVGSVKAETMKDTRGPGTSTVRAMLEELARRPGARAARDRAALRLLADLGLRRCEVVGLDVAHLDFAGARVAVLRKGKRERTWLSLTPAALEALRGWLEARGEEPGPLFRGIRGERLTGSGLWRVISTLGRRVGAKVRPHGLRHTAITEAVKRAQANGMQLEEVRDFSGHADVRTLMVYRDRERNVQGRLAALVSEAY